MSHEIEIRPTEAEKAAGAKKKIRVKGRDHSLTEVTNYETFDWPSVPGR